MVMAKLDRARRVLAFVGLLSLVFCPAPLLLAHQLGAQEPVHVYLVVDTSGSIKPHLGKLAERLELFVRYGFPRNVDGRITLVTFADEPKTGRIVRVGRPEQEKLIDDIKELKTGGATYIYGGLKHTFELLAKKAQVGAGAQRQYIVLITDEGDAPPPGKKQLSGNEESLNRIARAKGLTPGEDYFVLLAAFNTKVEKKLEGSIAELKGVSKPIDNIKWSSFQIQSAIRLKEILRRPETVAIRATIPIEAHNAKGAWANFRLVGAPDGVDCFAVYAF